MRVDPFLARDSTGNPIGWCPDRGPVRVQFTRLGVTRRAILYTAVKDMFALAGLTCVQGPDVVFHPTNLGCIGAPIDRSILIVALDDTDPLWQQWRADAWAADSPSPYPGERDGGCIVVNRTTPKEYLRMIGLHEAGHLLGLAHRPGAGKSVMNTYPDVTKPSATDIENLRVIGRQCRE